MTRLWQESFSRIFDEATKKATYKRQSTSAQEKGVSNCPLCAIIETGAKLLSGS